MHTERDVNKQGNINNILSAILRFYDAITDAQELSIATQPPDNGGSNPSDAPLLGDDAEWLSAIGFEVTAFDISESSIEWGKARFPSTDVDYIDADLLNPPTKWLNEYDLVVEIHILQAIPEEVRDPAASQIPGLLNSKGSLLCIGRLAGFQIPNESTPPWPLSRTWLEGRFSSLNPTSFQHFTYEESPSIDRYLASWIAD